MGVMRDKARPFELNSPGNELVKSEHSLIEAAKSVDSSSDSSSDEGPDNEELLQAEYNKLFQVGRGRGSTLEEKPTVPRSCGGLLATLSQSLFYQINFASCRYQSFATQSKQSAPTHVLLQPQRHPGTVPHYRIPAYLYLLSLNFRPWDLIRDIKTKGNRESGMSRRKRVGGGGLEEYERKRGMWKSAVQFLL